MAETSQTENVLRAGARVKLSEAGRAACHERLHACCGKIEQISDKGLAKVIFDSVEMNSGSTESTRKGGPYVPRMRTAMTVVPVKFLEAE